MHELLLKCNNLQLLFINDLDKRRVFGFRTVGWTKEAV